MVKVYKYLWNKRPRTPVLLQAVPEKQGMMQRFLRSIGYTTGESVVIVSEQDYKRLVALSRRKTNYNSVGRMVMELFLVHENQQFLEEMSQAYVKKENK
jgi:hypothetical protein